MTQSLAKCVVLGLNPAWQKTLRFDRFMPGQVNRAMFSSALASGKGINVARTLRTLGAAPVVVQFIGGSTGADVVEYLDAEELSHESQSIRGTTRICTTLLSDSDRSMTELIEPSPEVAPEELDALAVRLLDVESDALGVAISGTTPEGVPESFYGDVIRRMRTMAWVVLDASRGVAQALSAGPHLLKVNRAELRDISDCDDLEAGARKLLMRHPIMGVAVTDGAAAATLVLRDRTVGYHLPQLVDVVSPLGAGDAATGSLLSGLIGWSRSCGLRPDAAVEHVGFSEAVSNAFLRALATASASCMSEKPAVFDPGAVAEIEKEITVQCRAVE